MKGTGKANVATTTDDEEMVWVFVPTKLLREERGRTMMQGNSKRY